MKIKLYGVNINYEAIINRDFKVRIVITLEAKLFGKYGRNLLEKVYRIMEGKIKNSVNFYDYWCIIINPSDLEKTLKLVEKEYYAALKIIEDSEIEREEVEKSIRRKLDEKL